MIKVVTSAERHTSEKEWIHSEFSFSFADYDDPSNAHFGCLLAHNDNQLSPKQGFKKHPHHDLEIISYVISGTLEHNDDLGNVTRLPEGTVQVMSAGTGINHSETNPSDDAPVRFMQMWFLPTEPGLTPSWKSHSFSREERMNKLEPIVTGRMNNQGSEELLEIQSDITLYIPILETGQEIVFEQKDERRTYLFLITGNLEIDCNDGTFQLEPGDAARIRNNCELLHIKGTSSEGDAEFVLVDIP
ncbi:pirin family protein [Paenibacillus sp. HJL G12]|uniref:Pirin family protein n=1 Tax=Paenibacillus dendrobii TaxID=2691084 RepID=A0A7X3IPZ2_9BACL|nr:pirin family protein [Paenibacillus dendrobii]MWV47311.1 pirin family protein [Paenibacillus dendrobii]